MPMTRGNIIDKSDIVEYIESELMDKIYPIGSIYLSISPTSPSTLFGGTWEQLKDRFLLGAGDTYTNGTTGGSANATYTPSGTIGSHTLTTSEIPSHTHGLNNHVHSVGAHAHGLNSHKHNYVKATGTAGNSGNTSSTTISFSNGYADVCSGSRYIDFRFKSAVFNSTNGVEVYANYYSTTSYHGTSVELGGSQAHTHTLNGHTHTVNTSTVASDGPSTTNTANSTAFNSGGNTGDTTSTGGSGGHNHGFTGTAATINTMPPYLTVYMWKRTA